MVRIGTLLEVSDQSRNRHMVQIILGKIQCQNIRKRRKNRVSRQYELPEHTCKNVYNNSDARAKTDITDLSRTTNDVLKLRPVSYRFIDSPTQINHTQTLDRELGFIAQEVEKVLPEAVIADEDGGKLIDYISIIPMLTGCIKELHSRIAELETEINYYMTE